MTPRPPRPLCLFFPVLHNIGCRLEDEISRLKREQRKQLEELHTKQQRTRQKQMALLAEKVWLWRHALEGGSNKGEGEKGRRGGEETHPYTNTHTYIHTLTHALSCFCATWVTNRRERLHGCEPGRRHSRRQPSIHSHQPAAARARTGMGDCARVIRCCTSTTWRFGAQCLVACMCCFAHVVL